MNRFKCKSYYDDKDILRDCSCGKCGRTVEEVVEELVEQTMGVMMGAMVNTGSSTELTKDLIINAEKDALAAIERIRVEDRLKAKLEMINGILGTDAEVHQDIPDWLIKAFFAIRSKLQSKLEEK